MKSVLSQQSSLLSPTHHEPITPLKVSVFQYIQTGNTAQLMLCVSGMRRI